MATTKYSENEVRAMLDHWQILRNARTTTRPGIRLIVIMADLGRALKRMSVANRDVVFWHGLVGLSEDQVSELLGISQTWVSKRYRYAVEEITYLINGGR